MLERRPEFAARLFTEGERAYCDQKVDPAPYYAARFAAKEAAAKAVGRWLRWQEVEVVADAYNRPHLVLRGESASAARVADGAQLLVSLSHSQDYAVAVVALVRPDRPGERSVPEEGK